MHNARLLRAKEGRERNGNMPLRINNSKDSRPEIKLLFRFSRQRAFARVALCGHVRSISVIQYALSCSVGSHRVVKCHFARLSLDPHIVPVSPRTNVACKFLIARWLSRVALIPARSDLTRLFLLERTLRSRRDVVTVAVCTSFHME